MAQIRILVADDHELVRVGIRSLLSAHADFLTVCEACDGVDAISKAKEYQPDVSLPMPGSDGRI